MPDKNTPWDDVAKRGNPMRSSVVNDMIKRVKKFKARKQGAPSKARQALKESEFRSVVNILQQTDQTDVVVKCGIPALLTF